MANDVGVSHCRRAYLCRPICIGSGESADQDNADRHTPDMEDVNVLLGVVGGGILGIVGSFGSQAIANRGRKWERQQDRLDRAHNDLVEAINRFILATQLAEDAAAHYSDDGRLKGARASEMWAAYKSLTIRLHDEEFRAKAAQYCDDVAASLWHPNDAPAHTRIHESQRSFLRAAGKKIRQEDERRS